MKLKIVILLTTIVSACSTPNLAHRKVDSIENNFRNPVYAPAGPFADPAILKADDGNYYAYATQSASGKGAQNIQCAYSQDLVKWSPLPDCLPKKPAWANKKQNFWAPHVSFFEGRYVMYISAEQNSTGYCVAVGTADSPAGPFSNFQRLACGSDFRNIDPMAFEDPVSRRKFLYWGSASKPLLVQELTKDGLAFLPGSEAQSFLNPIREAYGQIKGPDGYTYAFGTQGGPEEKPSNVQIVKSRDFAEWTRVGDAVPKRPSWAFGKPDHWAPQVIELGGRYLMYLTIQKAKNEYCISVGFSSQLTGPFDEFKRLVCDKRFKLANPWISKNSDTSELTLYWEDTRPDSKITFFQRLAADGASFTGELQSTTEERPEFDLELKGYENLIEGPWVILHGGFYYMFYSGNDCCGRRAHYAVSVARSTNPLGPFVKMKDDLNLTDSVILKGNAEWMGPGHNSVVTDAKGDHWIVYHAIQKTKTHVKTGPKQKDLYRVMLIDKLVFKNGWPRIEAGQ